MSTGSCDRISERRRLSAVVALTAAYMFAEFVGGLWTGSLALLADAGHMLTDVASVSLALGALWIAQRPATTERTYGFARVEILAALINGLALWIVVAWIWIEAVDRMRSPEPVLAGPMVVIAAGGLVVNAVAFAILHRRSPSAAAPSLNLRGALLHVVGDLLGSVGAIVAGVVIWFSGWEMADPIVSLFIGGLILVSAWRLVADAVHILLEGTPRDLDIDALIKRICEVEGVVSVHDLHVWTITSGYPSLSAHVVCSHESEAELVRVKVNRVLRERFGLTHTTIQMESQIPPDHDEPMDHPVTTIE